MVPTLTGMQSSEGREFGFLKGLILRLLSARGVAGCRYSQITRSVSTQLTNDMERVLSHHTGRR